MRRAFLILMLTLAVFPISSAQAENDGSSAQNDGIPCDQGTLIPASVSPDGDTRPIGCVGAVDEDGELYSWVRIGDTYLLSNGVLVVENASWNSCPQHHFCLWNDANFSGYMTGSGCVCGWQNLGPYNNQMSSWRNRRPHDSKWAYERNGGSPIRCADSQSSLSYVGATNNDKASSIKLFTDDSQC